MSEHTGTKPLPETAQPNLQRLLNERERLDARLQAYVQGVADTLGLDDTWAFDMGSMSFIKRPQMEPVGET